MVQSPTSDESDKSSVESKRSCKEARYTEKRSKKRSYSSGEEKQDRRDRYEGSDGKQTQTRQREPSPLKTRIKSSGSKGVYKDPKRKSSSESSDDGRRESRSWKESANRNKKKDQPTSSKKSRAEDAREKINRNKGIASAEKHRSDRRREDSGGFESDNETPHSSRRIIRKGDNNTDKIRSRVRHPSPARKAGVKVSLKEPASGKRRHDTDSGSDEGFSDTETKKRMRREITPDIPAEKPDSDNDKTPVYRPRVYRDLDNPEPEAESLQRYWDAKVVKAVSPVEVRRSRSLTPGQVGGRYWDENTDSKVSEEGEIQKVLEEFRKERAAAPKVEPEKEKPEKKKVDDMLTTRTGGAYIPPARLRLMQQQITDKASPAYQRLAWEALKKSIHGLINKINVSNIALIVRQLFKENIVRGRGLLCRSIMQAQASSQTFTHVYAGLVSIINTKFPNIGELLLKRLILQFKRGFKRNDKNSCVAASKFIGHLVNQQVAHELVALEILTLLLEKPTDDSVEIAIGFLKEVGMKLRDVSPRGLNAVFESLRHVLNEAMLDKRVQYMIEVMYQVRKDGFKDNPAVLEELDLVEEQDQITHILSLEEVMPGSSEDMLNVFKHDADYLANEEKYDAVRREILGEENESEEESAGESGSDEESEGEEDEEKKQTIIDETETNLTALRRTIYLTIQSSLDHNECAHKLMKMQLKPGQEVELCNMILDCCAQQRTYEKFFGLLAQKFCQLRREYLGPFEQLFRDSYDTIHRIDIGKLRNVAKLFSHLLFSDAISWEVLSHIHLNEDETTSSSRIFIKILFQELAEYMGLQKLNERLKDPTLQPYFEGIFPRDNPKHTRFSINFFTSIGLGGLTDALREYLASQPKPTAIVPPLQRAQEAESESSTSESSDSDSDSSTDSEVERRVRQKLNELRTREEEEEEQKQSKREAEKAKEKRQREEREEVVPRREKEGRDKDSGRRGERKEEENKRHRKDREERSPRASKGEEYKRNKNDKEERSQRREKERDVEEKQRRYEELENRRQKEEREERDLEKGKERREKEERRQKEEREERDLEKEKERREKEERRQKDERDERKREKERERREKEERAEHKEKERRRHKDKEDKMSRREKEKRVESDHEEKRHDSRKSKKSGKEKSRRERSSS